MIVVESTNRSGVAVEVDAAEELARAVLAGEDMTDGELGLVWVGRDEMRRLKREHLGVDEAELGRRKARWTPPKPAMAGGYQSLYVERVLQADQGADLDFLVGCRGAAIPRESH